MGACETKRWHRLWRPPRGCLRARACSPNAPSRLFLRLRAQTRAQTRERSLAGSCGATRPSTNRRARSTCIGDCALANFLGSLKRIGITYEALLEPLDGPDSWRPDAMPCFWQVLLSMKSRSLLLVIVCTFTLVVVFYAFMFMLADYSEPKCGIAPKGQHATFYNVCPFTSAHTLTPVVACTLETPPSPLQPGLRVLTRDADNDRVCSAVRQG